MKSNFRNGILLALGLTAMVAAGMPAHADTVGADGADGVNLEWEQGKSSTWFIELQRYGLDLIKDGTSKENDAEIRQGMLVFDWGFAHQGTDGSFTTSGDLFHSASLFIESVAQATILLKSYNPVTYTKDATFYAGKISSYSTKLDLAARWLLIPSVAAQGQLFDQPYTHRRFLLAAALGETAKLTGDTTLLAPAVTYMQNGFPLQLTSGTEAVTYPDGIHNVSLVGVDPELGGYDVSYQMSGIRFAELYWMNGGNTSLKAQLNNLITLGDNWESTRIDVLGDIDATGSSRVGVGLNRDGTIKQINYGEVTDAFNYGYQITGNKAFAVYALRVNQGDQPISSNAVSAKGAVTTNALLDTGGATTCSVDLQKLGADYVSAGINLENPSIIAEGISIINWGFAHQAADGSFPTSSSDFYTGAQFIEAATRATVMLKNYKPATYSLASTVYGPTITSWTAGIQANATWMLRPDIIAANKTSVASLTNRQYVAAAALGEAGALLNNTAMTSAGITYITNALTVTQSTGVIPEAGVANVNYESRSLEYAEYFLPFIPAGTLHNNVVAMLNKCLTWESAYVDSTGKSTVSGPYQSISVSFALGYQETNTQLFGVVARRMGSL